MEEDEESQENELLALESIYDKHQFERSTDDKGGELNIYLDVLSPFQILLPPRRQSSAGIAPQAEDATQGAAVNHQKLTEITVNYLPPVVMNFKFPPDYPSKNPPVFTLSCKWLNKAQLSTLCSHLDEIWIENGPGSVVLFQWVQFLMDEIIPVLKIETPFPLGEISHQKHLTAEGDERAIQDIASITMLVHFLLEYNRVEKDRVFKLTYFLCDVCFLEKPGSDCIAFYPCEHVYCCNCMREYFKLKINEGGVNALLCPNDKCESKANPSQLKQLVDLETYEKYEKYMLQTTLDCMSDIIYCPRKICQSPAISEDESMCICPRCSFAFCTLCKRSYHGISPCPISDKDFDRVRKEYSRGTAKERAKLEQRYGKKNLKYLLEESVSEKWIKDNAKKCPYCSVIIQRSEGCNKMTCYKCHNNFCWLCMQKLDKSSPYTHYNTLGSRCNQKLFEGTQIQAFDPFDEFD
eukprot:gene7349-8167_t